MWHPNERVKYALINTAHRILTPRNRVTSYMGREEVKICGRPRKLVKVRNGFNPDCGDMSLSVVGSNMTEFIAENVFPVVQSSNKEKDYTTGEFPECKPTNYLDVILLYSYSTVVAAYVPGIRNADGTGGLLLVTDEFYSSTTTSHMSKWFTLIGNGRHMERKGDPTLMYHDVKFSETYVKRWKGKAMPARWKHESPLGLKKLMNSPWVEPADRYVLEGEVDEQ